MSKPIFICKTCGTEYSACPDCEKNRSWRTVADTADCWKIYITAIEIRDNIIADDEAISALKSAGITADTLNAAKLKTDVRNILEALFARNASKKKSRGRTYAVDKTNDEDNGLAEEAGADSTEEI